MLGLDCGFELWAWILSNDIGTWNVELWLEFGMDLKGLEEIFIGNIDAGQVRIYKFTTHKFFTKKENDIYKDKERNKTTDVDDEILKNEKIRSVNGKDLFEKNIIAIFESDLVRLALKDHKESKADMQLIKEIVFVKVQHMEILRQIINNGCNIFDKRYIFFTATTGQQRHQTVVLIEEDFYRKHKKNITCGLDIERINQRGGLNAGKYISYNALILSTSVPFENKIDLDKCIVVKGLETIVDELVKYLDVDSMKLYKEYIHYKDEAGNNGIKIEHTDGAGMFLPGEQISSFQVRGRYIKGAMFPFDFRKFAEKVAHNFIVTDYKGKEHDIIKEDIRYIFTTSQFKNCDYYDSWDEYKKICKEENIELTVNSWANEPTEKVRFAYQFLQTLRYNSNIDALKEIVCSYLNKCKNNLKYALEIIGLKFDPKKPKALAEAISLYPELVYDKRIINNIKQKVRDEMRYAKIGKFFVDGTYTYAMPDMYAFCEMLFMNSKNPEGLVPRNQVYCKVYDDNEDVKNVCVLRSPHLSGYEYAKRTLIKTNECKEWFVGYDTVVSIHDLITKTLQMDVDGDEVLITPEKAIWDLAEDTPPLYYEMTKAKRIIIDNEAIFDTLKKAFENCLVGFISNGETRLWNTESVEEVDDELICIETAYNNYSIDYPKTGVNLDLQKYPELWKRHLKYVGDFANGIKPQKKKPYFFIDKEKKSHKAVEASNYRSFEKCTNSVMDRINTQICNKIVQRYKYSDADKEFDYRMLMNNEKNEEGKLKYEVKTSMSYYFQLVKLLIELKKQEKKLAQEYDDFVFEDNNDKENWDNKFSLFEFNCVRKIKDVFTNKYYNENLAVNTLIHIYYNQDCLSNYMPNILWKCYGHIIVRNIADNLKRGYVPKTTKRKSYKQAMKKDIDKNAEVEKLIDELLHDKPLYIGKNEYEYILDMADKKECKATPKSKVIFALLCMYKAKVTNSDRNPKDIWLRIYMGKQKKKKRNENVKIIRHNFSNLDKNSHVSNGTSKAILEKIRNDTNDFCKIKHVRNKYYEIQFALSNDDIEFEIERYSNCIPDLYEHAGFNDAIVRKCIECGKKFLVKDNKDRKKTCSEVCKNVRVARKKSESYSKKKSIVI